MAAAWWKSDIKSRNKRFSHDALQTIKEERLMLHSSAYIVKLPYPVVLSYSVMPLTKK